MLVWQDYVAGTDPTDEADTFKAMIRMDGTTPIIEFTPELSAIEKAKRKYTIWGKTRLSDAAWVEVASGNEADYNFFKISVEMK